MSELLGRLTAWILEDAARREGTLSTTPFQARQGDVLLIPVADVPAGARAVPTSDGRVVLAFGEATGHAHAIRDRGATLLANGDDRFLRLTSPVTLAHEEHAAIDVPPGTYRVVIQREYVPAESQRAGWRPVAD